MIPDFEAGGNAEKEKPIQQRCDGGSISKVEGPQPTTRFSSPTIRAGSGVARNFKRGGGHNFHIFSSVFFSAELI